jgi:hypothetical protein
MTNTVAMSASLCYSPNAETHDPMGEPFSKKRPAELFRLSHPVKKMLPWLSSNNSAHFTTEMCWFAPSGYRLFLAVMRLRGK